MRAVGTAWIKIWNVQLPLLGIVGSWATRTYHSNGVLSCGWDPDVLPKRGWGPWGVRRRRLSLEDDLKPALPFGGTGNF